MFFFDKNILFKFNILKYFLSLYIPLSFNTIFLQYLFSKFMIINMNFYILKNGLIIIFFFF